MLRRPFMFLATLIIGLAAQAATAHLLVFEPARLRNDNHFLFEGFAAMQIGECVPFPNDPRGFYCDFRVEDDWSFDNPVNIVDETRIPPPGLPGVPGFDVACSPASDFPDGGNPTCPLPPLFPGGPPGFGSCVPLGPSTGTCDLSAGSPRPRAGAGLSSTFTSREDVDVDVGVYEYQPSWGEITFIAVAQTPACAENIGFFPTVAWAGPLGLKDSRTGELLFEDLDDFDDLPEEIEEGLPPGYGLRVTKPAKRYHPSRFDPRPGFYSGFGQTAWLYNKGTEIEPCIEDAEACAADPDSTHFDNNDFFNVTHGAPVTFYALWWADDEGGHRRDHKGFRSRGRLLDATMILGTADRFTPGDFALLDVTGKGTANGRTVHGRCSDPRRTGKVDILIEGPPECFDAADNDGDGLTDFDPRPGFGDPDCTSPAGDEGSAP